MTICIQCDKEAYKYRGKTYKLCASCGLNALMQAMNYSDDKDKSAKEKVDEIIHYRKLDEIN